MDTSKPLSRENGSLESGKKPMTKFYTFRQNNSGGGFVYDPDEGIGLYVIIEADDEDHAIRRAEEIGLYFDGVESRGDCECCGDRWYPDYDSDALPSEPMVGDETPEEAVAHGEDGFYGMDKTIFIHYLSGEIRAY